MGIGTVISSIMAVVLSMAIVLGLAWGSLYLLRRWQDRASGGTMGAGNDRTLRFVRALPLGPRERVVLIESDGELMLLGVTAGGVTMLTRWDADGVKVAEEAPVAPAAPVTPRLPPQPPGGQWR